MAVDTHAASPFEGNIYLAWTDFLNPQDPFALDNWQIKAVVSRDGGQTWSDPTAISPAAQFPLGISGSLPVVAADGTVYVFYADFISRTGPLTIQFQVDRRKRHLERAGARGLQPSEPRTLQIAERIWQDKRLDEANVDSDTFYTNTQDGAAFAPNAGVSTATSLAGLATFIGDYNYLAVSEDRLYPVWTDRRLGNNDIFTALGSRASAGP